MLDDCCKAMYASPRVRSTGFEMQYWPAGKGDEENETTIAIKSEMRDLEVRNI